MYSKYSGYVDGYFATTGCPTLLESVTLEFKFSVMVGVMVFKFWGKLDMYIGFNVHLLKIVCNQLLKRNSFFIEVTSNKKNV